MTRWTNIYLQCPMYNGEPPEPYPDWHAFIEEQQNQLNALRQLGPHRRFYPTHMRGPDYCRFETATGAPINTPFWQQFDRARNIPDPANYRCRTHHVAPIIWARQDAWHRRMAPIRDRVWVQDRVALNPEADPNQTWNQDINLNPFWVTIWKRRRPPLRTLHNAWNETTT